MKPTKCPAREKKRGKKSEKKGRREREKSKLRLLCHFQTPKHARTLQANILHLDQKAAKWTTCKQLCGEF